MRNVSFSGHSITETLPSGKTIRVTRADDGAHWAFDIGTPDVPEERVRFALSAEAFSALEEMADALKRPATHARWTYVVSLTGAMAPPAEPSSDEAPQVVR